MTRWIAKSGLAGLALLLCGAALSSQPPDPLPPDEEEQQIFVDGDRLPIFVTGMPRCRPLAGDPLDAVDVRTAFGSQQVLSADDTGRIGVHRDNDPITGPETWQRAGTAIRNFVFRAPLDGSPLCIGARSRNTGGFAQLRRVQDASVAHGKYVRFTGWVATRLATEARLWLAVGDDAAVMRGGDTSPAPFYGTHGWTPVMLTIGPIPERATKLSYGFLLMGQGDVWLTEPRIEILEERPPGMRGGGLLVSVGRR